MASPSVLCPSMEVLSAFGSGTLTVKGEETIQNHLNACETCRSRYAQLTETSSESTARSDAVANASAVPSVLAQHPTYRIDRELGRGGMGVVYLGFDRLMERPVVIKVVNKELLKKPGATVAFFVKSAPRHVCIIRM